MSLLDELGSGYVDEYFRDALLLDGNTLYSIQGCTPSRITAAYVPLDNIEHGWKSTYLDKQKLSSFADLAWPKLGYRNLATAAGPNLVAFVTSQRSVLRGMRANLLHWNDSTEKSGMTISEQRPASNSLHRLQAVFRPTFYRFGEGMDKIESGDWAGFALNEDVAIVLSCSSSSSLCDILFRDKKVGSVSDRREINITNRIFKRSSFRKLMGT